MRGFGRGEETHSMQNRRRGYPKGTGREFDLLGERGGKRNYAGLWQGERYRVCLV